MNNSRRTQRIMEKLEDRILFDAVPDGDFLVHETQDQPLFVQEQSAQSIQQVEQTSPRELILIDAGVKNSNELLNEILSANPDRSYEVRLLSAELGGIEQVSVILEQAGEPYSAIHILSHGSDGSIQLGNSDLDSSSLAANAGEIALWTNSLTEDADLLLYGCNLAQSASGEEFLESLSRVTGADVAASDDLTGSSSLGGDWELEFQTGKLETTAFAVFNYKSVLAPPSVDVDADDSEASGADYVSSFQPGGAPANITDSDVVVTDSDGDDLSQISINVAGVENALNEFVTFNGDASSVAILLDAASYDHKITIASTTYDIDFDGNTFTVTNGNGGDLTNTEVEVFLTSTTFHTTVSATQARTFSITVIDSNSESSTNAVTTLELDTDGDGVHDLHDIDDDNDGILDLNEGFIGVGSAGVSATYNVDAQLVGGDAFAKGEHVQIGVNSNGTFGADTSNTPTGYVDITADGRDDGNGLLGFISDTDKDGFAGGDYDGDYFTPGSPEEGFGVEIGGTNYNNNTSGSLGQIAGGLTGVAVGETADVNWSGAVSGLDVDRKVSVNEDGLFIRMEVTLTNNSGGNLNDIYFMHNVDPDNDRSLHGDYATLNTIESQANESGSALSLVTAQQNASGAGVSGGTEDTGSSVALVSMDARSRVSFGGFANRSASDVYNAAGGLTGTVGASATHDRAISLAFDVGTLNNGETTTLVYYYNMAGDPTDISDILAYESGTNTDDSNAFTNQYDHHDVDSDDDGIADNIEAQSTAGYIAASGIDADRDGLDDAYDQNIGDTTAVASVGLIPVDSDGDGVADVLDTDSDNDFVADQFESGVPAVTDATYSDVNGSIDDPANNLADTFGTSELDFREAGADSDGDGIANDDDDDDDNDGILDVNEDFNPAIKTWINQVGTNIAANSDSLDFSYSGGSGWSGTIHSEDISTFGYGDQFEFSFTVNNTSSKAFMIGLNESGTNTTASYTDIDHAIYINGNNVYVYENGSSQGSFGTYSAGDTFSIEVDGSTLMYKRNGTSLLTRTVTAGTDYYIDSSFHASSGYPDYSIENLSLMPTNLTEAQLLDADGDGLINRLDLDSDNDGIADNIEAQATGAYVGPTGIYDADGVDLAYTGLPGGGLSPVDSDGDGTADFLDADSDNDGASDQAESGIAPTTDATYSDVNGSIDDPDNNLANTFGTFELDFREDGIDTDGDGIENDVDLDDDNDGILDSEEYIDAYLRNWVNLTGSNISTSGSSIEFAYNSGSGWNNSVHSDDFSALGYSDQFELSFNVSSTGSKAFMIGLNESGTNTTSSYTDIDHAIYFNGSNFYVYENGSYQGSFGSYSSTDTFSIEVDGTTLNYQRNGTTFLTRSITAGKDYYVDSSFYSHSSYSDFSIDNLAITPIDVSAYQLSDADGDGVINSLDLDSDNDGISDLFESGDSAAIALDANNDGTVSLSEADAFDANDGDLDNDGLMDVFEDGNLSLDAGTTAVDTDGDGTEDYMDLDSDNDGIADTIEARPTSGYDHHIDNGADNIDSDGDGVLDKFDNNSVFGATHSNFNAPVNTDGTDNADFRDLDSDNDGFLDSVESGLGSSDATYSDPDGSVNNPLADLANNDNDSSEADYRSLGDFTDNNESISVNEDVTLTGSVLTGTSSVEGPISVTEFTIDGSTYAPGATANITGVGSLTISNDGSFSFTPFADYFGSVPIINYSMTDGVYTDSSTMALSIDPVNDDFTDADESLSVNEDSSLTGNVLAGTSSVDGPVSVLDFSVDGSSYSAGDTATISNVGTIQIDSNGTLTFTSVADYFGAVLAVSYTVTDGSGTNETSTLTLTVDPTNDNFTDADESYSVDEDNSLAGNLLVGTTSVDGAVSIAGFSIGGTAHGAGSTAAILGVGTIEIESDGDFTFTPDANFNGTVPSINYTITDGSGTDDTSILAIFVDATNDDPIAFDDGVTTNEDTIATGSVFADNGNGADFDLDGDTLAVNAVDGQAANIGVAVAGSAGGLFTINTDGIFSFDPNGDFDHLDVTESTTTSVAYSVEDGFGGTASATATVTVTGVNEVIANDDATYKVFKDHVLSVSVSGVLENDVDPELSALPGITSALSMNGSGGTGTSFQNLPGNPTNGNASFELWVRPSDISDHDTLFETGATGDGLAISLDETTLIFEARNNNGGNTGRERVSVDLTTIGITDPTSEFIQIVGTIEIGGDLNLYVNGAFAGGTPATDINDWAGGNGTGFGQNNGGSTIGGATGFEGELALFRFYESALTLGAIQDNYNSVAVDTGIAATAGATLVIDPALDEDSADTSISSSGAATYNVSLNGSTAGTGLRVTEINGQTADVGSAVTLASGAIATLNEDGSFDYDPNGQFDHLFGAATAIDSFTYTVTDQNGATDTATVTITICHDNAAPTASSDSESTDEDVMLSGNVIANDSDPDGDALSITQYDVGGAIYLAGQTANLAEGDLTINADGSYTFVPTAHYHGTVPVITYTITDAVETANSTLTIAVNSVNDNFSDDNEILNVDEDSMLTNNVLTGTTSPDGPVSVGGFFVGGSFYSAGDTATLSGVGSLTLNSDGSISFTPVTNFNGSVPTIIYTVTDGSGTDDISTLTINVAPTDDDFTDADESFNFDEDDSLTGNVLTGTASVDGPVTVTDFTVDGTTYAAGNLATISGVGALQFGSNGDFSFTPIANYNGSVPLVTYSTTDGLGTDDTSTLSITVDPVNDDFVDADESFDVDEDDTLFEHVLSGTSSVDGTVSVVDFMVGGTNYSAGDTANISGVGSLSIDSGGNLTFTPVGNYNGPVPTVTYTTTDGSGADDSSTVAITVNPVNDDFNDTDESYNIDEDNSLTDNVLTGTSSVDGAVTVTDFNVAGGIYGAGDTANIAGVGTLQINSDGSFAFTPVANYHGAVPAAIYTTTDGSGTDDTSTLSITIDPVNDDYNDADESFSFDEDTTLTNNVLTGTTSVDGPVTVVTFEVGGSSFLAGDTANITGVGTLQINNDGSFTFAPVAHYDGAVPPATYTTTDGSGLNDSSLLLISINAVNDDFTDSDESFNVNEDDTLSDNLLTGTSSFDGPVSIAGFSVSGSSYTAGDTATISGIGTLQINSHGSFSFTPAANYNGLVPLITYTITDGSGTDDTSTLAITVDPVNDDFVDTNESFNVDEDDILINNVLTGTSSVDGPVTVTGFDVGGSPHVAGDTAIISGVGSLTLNIDGSFEFTPVANYNGPVPTVSYTTSDGSGTDNTSTLSINVNPINDDFTDGDETFSIDEDDSLSGNVLSGTSSVDGPVTVLQFSVGGTAYSTGDTATIAGVGDITIAIDGSFTFSPVANYNGPVPSVTYTLTDGSGSDDSSTLSITVDAVNDDFVDADETLFVNEDDILNDNVLNGTSSVDGPVSVSGFSVAGSSYSAGDTATIAGVGTITIAGDGSLTFIPVADYNGPVQNVAYTVTDGSGTDVVSTLSITVNPVNDDFTDANENLTVNEDDSLNDSVLTGTTSVDGPVAVSSFRIGGTTYAAGDTAVIVGVASVSIANDGSLTFTPVADYYGPVPSVLYTVTDGSGTDVTSTLSITVDPINDDFNDSSESFNFNEDETLSDNVLTGTSSADGPVTVSDFSVGGSTYSAGDTAAIAGIGSISITSAGNLMFVPVANYNGPVPTVSYTVTDGSGSDVVSSLSITVDPVNDDFTDDSEILSVDEDDVIIDNVLTGTSSVDGPVTVSGFSVGGGSYSAGDAAFIAGVGSLSISSDGSMTFAPVADYYGPVPTASYTITDGSGNDVVSTISITVDPINDDFTDSSEALSVNEDDVLVDNILTGTSSVDGPVTASEYSVNGSNYSAGDTATIPDVGTITIASDGSLTFLPMANYNGPVPTVSYTLTDGSGANVVSTLSITVDPVNDDFTDEDKAISVDEDGVLVDNILVGTTSADGPVTVADFSVGGISYSAGDTAIIAGVGAIAIASDGSLTFTPIANYNGSVPTVSYTATDGSGVDVVSTISITVDPINDDFTDSDETLSVDEDDVLIDNVMSGTTSVDGPVTVTGFSIGGANYAAGSTATILGAGTLTIASNGDLTFTPIPDFNGTIPIASYTVTDGSGPDVVSSVSITVAPVNDDFIDASETFSVDEDDSLSENILTGTSSADGPVSISEFNIAGSTFVAGETATIVGVGSLTIAIDGSLTFTPVANYNGSVPTIHYTVTDGSGTDVTSSVSITVEPINDNFIDSNETLNVHEDNSLNDNVLIGTSSVDGPVSVTGFTSGGISFTAGATATIAGIGELSIGSDGSLTFNPVANFYGSVPTVSYIVTDGSGSDVVSTLSISVDPVNDNFTDTDEILTVNEDNVLSDNVLSGTSSVDGPVSVSGFSVGGRTYAIGDTATIAGVGTLTITSNGSLTFSPIADYNGAVPTVSYTVTDGSGADVVSTLSITVDPVDDNFTDANEVLTVDEDTVLTKNVLSGTFSVDGPVTVSQFSVGGANYTADDTANISGVGTLTIASDGSLTFSPIADYNGPVPTVSYTVTDGSGADVVSTLSITVVAVNDVPKTAGTISNQSNDDNDTVTGFDVSGFFHDIDGDTLLFDDAGSLPPGLSIDPSTAVISGILDSSASIGGPYTVTIIATDLNGKSITQAFEWVVNNPAPIATDNEFSISEDEASPASSNLITGNTGSGIDNDPDNDLLLVAEVDGVVISGATNIPGVYGTLTVRPDGNYQYNLHTADVQKLAAGDTVREIFYYTVTDGEGGTSNAQLVVDVIGANDTPVQLFAVPDQLSQENEPITALNVADFVDDIDNNETLNFDAQGTLPPGLSIDPSTGIISGTVDVLASSSGPFDVKILVTDSHGKSVEVSIEWNIQPFYRFDAFNDIAKEEFKTEFEATVITGETREVVFSQRIQSLAPEPILAGSAKPGTVLVGRIYAADGSIVGEASDTANSAGNWVMNFNDIEADGQTRVVIEHVATEEVALGQSNITLNSESYRSLQLGTTHTDALTAGSILSSSPFSSINEMGQQNINPLDLLSGNS